MDFCSWLCILKAVSKRLSKNKVTHWYRRHTQVSEPRGVKKTADISSGCWSIGGTAHQDQVCRGEAWPPLTYKNSYHLFISSACWWPLAVGRRTNGCQWDRQYFWQTDLKLVGLGPGALRAAPWPSVMSLNPSWLNSAWTNSYIHCLLWSVWRNTSWIFRVVPWGGHMSPRVDNT